MLWPVFLNHLKLFFITWLICIMFRRKDVSRCFFVYPKGETHISCYVKHAHINTHTDTRLFIY